MTDLATAIRAAADRIIELTGLRDSWREPIADCLQPLFDDQARRIAELEQQLADANERAAYAYENAMYGFRQDGIEFYEVDADGEADGDPRKIVWCHGTGDSSVGIGPSSWWQVEKPSELEQQVNRLQNECAHKEADLKEAETKTDRRASDQIALMVRQVLGVPQTRPHARQLTALGPDLDQFKNQFEAERDRLKQQLAILQNVCRKCDAMLSAAGFPGGSTEGQVERALKQLAKSGRRESAMRAALEPFANHYEGDLSNCGSGTLVSPTFKLQAFKDAKAALQPQAAADWLSPAEALGSR